MDTIEVETDAQAADMLNHFSSTELRGLCSNLGVSRERGDTKRETAERLVAQAPGVVARIIDNDDEVDMNASAFRKRREIGADEVSLEEAERRARSKKLQYRLQHIRTELKAKPNYNASVNWDYGASTSPEGAEPGIVSVHIRPSDEVHVLLGYRAQAIFRHTGGAVTLRIDDRDYAENHPDSPRRAFQLFESALGRLYDPAD